MSNVFSQYLKELEAELSRLNSKEERGQAGERLTNNKQDLKKRIKKLKDLINNKGNQYLVRKKEGYLSANNSFSSNRELAYVFDENEAIDKARAVLGWIEEY